MLHEDIEAAPPAPGADATLQGLHREWANLCEQKNTLTFKIDDTEMAARKAGRDVSQKLDLMRVRIDNLEPRIAALEAAMMSRRAANIADLVVLFDLAIGRCDLTMPDVTDFEAGRGDAAVKFARELLRMAPAGTVLTRTRSEFGDTWAAIAKAA
jgi:hypothetical protein